MVLPRLCLTGATLGDLYRQEALLAAAWDALLRLAANAKSLDLLAVVGLPVRQGGRLYDCAAAIGGGELLWLCPRREAQAPFSPCLLYTSSWLPRGPAGSSAQPLIYWRAFRRWYTDFSA